MVPEYRDIESWLALSSEERRFSTSIEPNSLKVKCGFIPEQVRRILNEYSKVKDQRVFEKSFEMHLQTGSTPVSLVEMVQRYTAARDNYDRFIALYAEGMTCSVRDKTI